MAAAICKAEPGDLEAIAWLGEEDSLGGAWLPETAAAYRAAFRAIAASAENTLYVAEIEGRVEGTFQITFTTSLTGRGAPRVKVESVNVAAALRSHGTGAGMMAFAEERARERGAHTLDLASNKRRADARRFYERLGFARSHEGLKKAP